MMRMNRTYCLLLISTILCVSLMTIFQSFPSNKISSKVRSNFRTVLYYTTFFSSDAMSPLGKPDVYHCSADCQITSNREYVSEADIVIFHAWDISSKTVHVPAIFQSQRWIYYNREAPINNQWRQMLFLKSHGSQVDGIMSYRLDSDIFFPYGRIVEKKEIDEVQVLPLKKEVKVAWFVSNCHTSSKREELAKQLSKFISVHIYGKCGSYSCSRHHEAACNSMLEREYTFYLAFENSLCRDYITEKIYRTLRLNVIPVVLTHPDNLRLLPNGSYIDAGSFKSVKSLAEYMHTVGRDGTLYNSFFKWKSRYVSEKLSPQEELCLPCYQPKIRDRVFEKSSDSWQKWWLRDANCITWPYTH